MGTIITNSIPTEPVSADIPGRLRNLAIGGVLAAAAEICIPFGAVIAETLWMGATVKSQFENIHHYGFKKRTLSSMALGAVSGLALGAAVSYGMAHVPAASEMTRRVRPEVYAALPQWGKNLSDDASRLGDRLGRMVFSGPK